MSVTISLIVSTYEQPISLAKVLKGISLQKQWPTEIFITDDGSGEETRAQIENWRREASVPVRHLWQAHHGFRKTQLLNQAVAAATGNYLVFLDGDCVPHGKFIADHASLAEQGFWVQGRRCYVEEKWVSEFEPGKTPILSWIIARRLRGVAKALRFPEPIILRNQQQRGIIGCNMAFWRADVLAVNGFDEAIVGRGIGPDSDLGTRVYNLGRRRKFVYGQAIVYHLNHPVAPRDNLEAKKQALAETIRTRKIRCELGVELYLQRPTRSN